MHDRKRWPVAPDHGPRGLAEPEQRTDGNVEPDHGTDGVGTSDQRTHGNTEPDQ
jgi:hypothetical protein